MRPTILVAESERFSPEAVAILERVGDVRLADLDRRGLLAAVRDAEVLWVRLRNRIDAEALDAAPRLRAIVTPTTGVNHIDVAQAERRGVRVLSLRGEETFLRDIRATAEHTMGLMLAALRHLPAAAEHVRAGGWDRDHFRGRELYRSTVGLVGYGRLGRIVGRYLTAFGATVLAVDPHRTAAELEDGVVLVCLDELLQRSRIVSVHVPLTSETQGLIGREELALLPPGAVLVNTSRGEVLDEPAIVDALLSGHLGAAAVDVLADERPDGMGHSPLVAHARAHDNVIVTPHIGGATRESMERTERFMAEKLATILLGSA